PATKTNADHYSSLQDFYARNGVQLQTYTINGTTGGSFTTAKGANVNISANCFIDIYGKPVTGNVTIQIKEIYTKSDMLLSDKPPMYYQVPLKSGGEFYIKAMSNGSVVYLNGKSPINVSQPLNGWPLDNMMQAFKLSPDTGGSFFGGWQPAPRPDTVTTSLSGYVFSLYNFCYPADSGAWCNSDNSSYFSAYTQTVFTIQTTDDSLNNNYVGNVDVFLLFNGINSMVHVYGGATNTFPYNYAPLGLQCTVVAIETRANGQLRSAFVPTTITANGTVNFNCTNTTTANFKTQLSTYNH
ncbi:MAG TPA: hypothetical protein VK890_01040, partial [Bacteroidia bacterium]|nr:hypothetical protein [Bacteroidia bacterium]